VTNTPEIKVLENLSEEEAYLFAILSDPSGLDQAEFLWQDQSSEDNKFCPHCGTEANGVHLHEHDELAPEEWEVKYSAPSQCFRAWAFQWPWWRCSDSMQVSQSARSVGKSLSLTVRACAFPFLFPGQEMVITAPELVHLEPVVGLIENRCYATRTLREMIPPGKSAFTHRPFQANFRNGARIIGRIPQRDGKGVKGCVTGEALILTDGGYCRADELRVGDRVLAHEGKYMPVTAIHEDKNDCYEVRGQSSFPLTVSCDHRFLGSENTATPKQKRALLPLGWHDVEWLVEHQVYWATPTRFPELPVPAVDPGAYGKPVNQGCREFWWLVGRYLADGVLTQATEYSRRVHWIAPERKLPELLASITVCGGSPAVVEREHSSASDVQWCSTSLANWLEVNFGRKAYGKRIPAWLLGAPRNVRNAVLEGYLAGDGCYIAERKRWDVGTASRVLATGVQMLAQSLGFTVNCSVIQPEVTEICGVELKTKPMLSWRLQIGHGHPFVVGDYLVGKVKTVTPVGIQTVYDIRVADDHSYLTGSIMSHNLHPIWLELDESQDFPHSGWIELNETLKRGFEGAMWRAHGVTKGVRDDFYEITQDRPDNHWTIHRFAAMWRPTWTDRERQQAIQKYGSREDPDYRRNILGLHGDKTNPIFVLTQLMKNVDNDPLSDYNSGEYFRKIIKSEKLELFKESILDELDFPLGHLTYAGGTQQERHDQPKAFYWVGMDVGFTIDPSEILVFVEYKPKANGHSVLRLLTRISMVRMPHRDQIQAMLHVIDFYRPKAFALDRGGVGLPLYQELAEHIEAFRAGDVDRIPAWMATYDLETTLTTIKGYSFGEKLLVEIDPTVEFSPNDNMQDMAAKAGMRRNAKELGTDVLRELVDAQRLWLPWDEDLLQQFQGGTWTSNRSMDAYGRRIFSRGNDHVLDAAREAALAWSQHAIEELMRVVPQQPVLDVAITAW
jgi:intein/homing endonuclease